jgi:hypothetical protein
VQDIVEHCTGRLERAGRKVVNSHQPYWPRDREELNLPKRAEWAPSSTDDRI